MEVIYKNIRWQSIVLFLVAFLFIISLDSCKTKQNYYKNCFTKWEEQTGNRFYDSLEKFESLMLKKKLLNRKDKKSYIELFRNISVKDSLTRQFFDSIKPSLISREIIDGRFRMIIVCSDIPYDEIINNKIECTPDNFQRYYFHKLTYEKIDYDEIIDGILLFSDYKDRYSRLNVAYLSFLYMEEFFK